MMLVICVLILLYKSIYYGYSFDCVNKFMKAYVVGTHLNCLDKLRQFR